MIVNSAPQNLVSIFKRPPQHSVVKSWGTETWYLNSEEENLCGKILFVRKGEGFKSHFHVKKFETFVILSGAVEITLTDTTDRSFHSGLLTEGDCLDIKRFMPHAIKAIEDTRILEISTFHRDEDSYRI